jgi:hypothetical protein
MKPKDNQEVAMRQFIRLSLKDITNLKKTTSTQEPKKLPQNSENLQFCEQLQEETLVEPVVNNSVVYDASDISVSNNVFGDFDPKNNIFADLDDDDPNAVPKNNSFDVFTSESTIYGEENNVSRLSVGSYNSEELADLTPTQVSQALADTLCVKDDGKGLTDFTVLIVKRKEIFAFISSSVSHTNIVRAIISS